jgi:hypothetical protein
VALDSRKRWSYMHVSIEAITPLSIGGATRP